MVSEVCTRSWIHLLANPRHLRPPLHRLHRLGPDGALWVLEGCYVEKKLRVNTTARFVSPFFCPSRGLASCLLWGQNEDVLLKTTGFNPLVIARDQFCKFSDGLELLKTSRHAQEDTVLLWCWDDKVSRFSPLPLSVCYAPATIEQHSGHFHPFNFVPELCSSFSAPDFCTVNMGRGIRIINAPVAKLPVAQERCVRNYLSNKISGRRGLTYVSSILTPRIGSNSWPEHDESFETSFSLVGQIP